MLVPMKEMLEKAKRERYAIGAFDVLNLETCKGVLDAAVELRSPVIVAVPEAFGDICGLDALIGSFKILAAPLDIPVAIILDHGPSYESCIRAIRAGMTTVMFDGSRLSMAENIAITREVVKAARAVGVTVEAEVGHVGSGMASAESADGDHTKFTDPAEAVEFVKATGVDALAVAVGTAHGLYAGTPKIEYELLKTLSKEVPVPLVLHGGSSTGDERLAQAVADGIQKINIFTDMSVKAVADIKASMDDPKGRVWMGSIAGQALASFKEVSAHYMKLFGSVGKA
jgi:ketose-bisphosphate aldolase